MPGKTVEEYSKIFYNKDIMASDEAIFIRLKEMGYVLRVSGMPILYLTLCALLMYIVHLLHRIW